MRICEYSSIVKRAGQEGWLRELTEAHAAPCTQDEALKILALLPNMPPLRLLFRAGARGRARFSRRTTRYGMTLPSVPGGKFGRLRAGLVLHEAAHILTHLETKHFDHQEIFCRTLRRLLVNIDWRAQMPTTSFATIFHRHRGQKYSLSLIREIDHGGKRGVEQVSDRIFLPLREQDEGRPRARTFNAEDAHEEARMLVTDPRENVKSVFVFGESESQFIGAAYHRGETYRPWAEEVAAMDDPQPEGVLADAVQAIEIITTDKGLLPPAESVNAPVTDWKKIGTETVKPKPPRKIGLALQVAPGSEAKWPPAASAQHILATFKAHGQMTAKAAVDLVGPKLVELGVAHPASAVSRLKQAGLLEEVAA